MKNNEVRTAIQELIVQYETNTHSGYANSCPLCKIFKTNDIYSGHHKRDCGRCPNVTFGSFIGCVDREKYTKLYWDDKNNNPFLAEFWTKVLALIAENNKQYTLSITKQKQIKAIAENYR